ncbi:MAG TPA: exopolysaccharide biosynthesis protein [Candidatus Hydrogenedentes bacterium]|nr:exopolysaccharide biosynthesis protein [Candidatus Hydrogenedentota bacterium]
MELRGLLTRADGRDMRLGEIIDSFPHRGHVLMIVLFSFPMSLPISPPFLGGVFGAVLTFLSFYLVIGKKPWLPQYIHNRLVSHRVLASTINRLTGVMRYLEFVLKPRMLFMTNNARVWRMHGLFLLGMAVILALPIPMPAPFTNSVAALPIFLASLGMLERDGVCIIVGYLSTLICISYYVALVVLGKEAFDFASAWLAGLP